MTTAPQDWPKQFILNAYAAALEHGFIILRPINEEQAKSFTQRFYRIRRRSDKATASFIPPEYHLVGVGHWQPGEDGRGLLPIIYNKLPDGTPLPNIEPATEDQMIELGSVEVIQPLPLPAAPAAAPIPPLQLEDEDLQLDEAEITSFVERMKQKARRE